MGNETQMLIVAAYQDIEATRGGIRTPDLTRVQHNGLTYNRFHVTAVCSPTPAALLTGRNHHRVGMGDIAESPSPFPGYTGVRPQSCTAVPWILSETGYITGGFGKWHMTPGHEMGAAGPVDHWPTGWGFEAPGGRGRDRAARCHCPGRSRARRCRLSPDPHARDGRSHPPPRRR